MCLANIKTCSIQLKKAVSDSNLESRQRVETLKKFKYKLVFICVTCFGQYIIPMSSVLLFHSFDDFMPICHILE